MSGKNLEISEGDFGALLMRIKEMGLTQTERDFIFESLQLKSDYCSQAILAYVEFLEEECQSLIGGLELIANNKTPKVITEAEQAENTLNETIDLIGLN